MNFDLAPGEKKEFTLESFPEGFKGKADFLVSWTCGGCKKELEKKVSAFVYSGVPAIEVDVFCPDCTPWRLRFYSLMARWLRGLKRPS